MNLLKLLQRVTYTGNKILYIDGLRFFAVVSVFIAHFFDYYSDNYPAFDEKFNISKYKYTSGVGVLLFFAISGFIISLPFIKQYVYNEKKVSIKNYFIRRLTRLEPPYILLLILFFLLQVFVFHSKSFSELFPHFLASLFYSHNLIYHEMPVINPVLWTLEIEVQFYIIAPLILLIFKTNKLIRRTILLLVIFGWSSFNFIPNLGFKNLLDYLPYFLLGIFCADIYLDNKIEIKKHIIFDIICFAAIIIIFINPNQNIFFLTIIALLTLSNKSKYFIKLLERKLLYIIGGLCYSIYMLHQKLIYLLNAFYPPNKIFFNNYYLDFGIKFIITAIVVLVSSSIFFILVERPTMKKNWWRYRDFKKLFFE